MRKTAITLILISSLLFFANTGSFLLKSTYAQLPLDILINADGSVTPSTTPIIVSSNIYQFTSTIKGQIEIRGKNNIIIDGNGFTLQGPGGMGIWLNNVNNVTITNLTIQGHFENALYLTSSCDNCIYDNHMNSNDYCGIELDNASNNNVIFDNSVTNNGFAGIGLCNFSPVPNALYGSDLNNIYDNNISFNKNYGIFISNASRNIIYHNDIVNNSYAGIGLASSSKNQFYLNRLVNNSLNAQIGGFIPAWIANSGIGGLGANIWDNGSIGNYWSDYASKYPNASQIGSSGIGNSPYIIDSDNTDRYPLMVSSVQPVTPITETPMTSVDLSNENGLVSMVVVVGVALVCASIIGTGLFYYRRKRSR